MHEHPRLEKKKKWNGVDKDVGWWIEKIRLKFVWKDCKKQRSQNGGNVTSIDRQTRMGRKEECN